MNRGRSLLIEILSGIIGFIAMCIGRRAAAMAAFQTLALTRPWHESFFTTIRNTFRSVSHANLEISHCAIQKDRRKNGTSGIFEPHAFTTPTHNLLEELQWRHLRVRVYGRINCVTKNKSQSLVSSWLPICVQG